MVMEPVNSAPETEDSEIKLNNSGAISICDVKSNCDNTFRNLDSGKEKMKTRDRPSFQYKIVFCVVCTIIAAGFTAPIIVYAIDAGKGGYGDATLNRFNITNCSSSSYTKVSRHKTTCNY